MRYICPPTTILIHGAIVVGTLTIRAYVTPAIVPVSIALRHRGVRGHAGRAIDCVVHREQLSG